MKLDVNLTRELLLQLEDFPIRSGGVVHIVPDDDTLAVPGYTLEQINYHLSQVEKSGFIDNGGLHPMVGIGFRCLTPTGHDFLDTIRDPEIWRKTSDTAKKAGAGSIDTFRSIARGIIKTKIERHMELKLRAQLRALFRYQITTFDLQSGNYRSELEGKTAASPSNISYQQSLKKWRLEAIENVGEESTDEIYNDELSLIDEIIRLKTQVKPEPLSRKVFIVHGRDDATKNEVAFFISAIGLEPIILHLRPNKGRHLLTKFQEESEGAGFAIVLLTPDDEGGIAGAGILHNRARQNVIFELGFFIGKLKPENVTALLKGGVEKPSDFDGVAYISFDTNGGWKHLLLRELHEAKVPYDAEKARTA